MTDIRRDIVEKFTFRNGDRSVTVDATIDTGAELTQIPFDIAAALGLTLVREIDFSLADGSRTAGHVYQCIVAWSIYEGHGYWSLQDVGCTRNGGALIGLDFLRKHELSVDMHHGGLIGTAPPNAVPLTGGGYVLNPPRGWVAERNYLRAKSAKPGDVLRPHPYWRFRVPTMIKTPADSIAPENPEERPSPTPPNER